MLPNAARRLSEVPGFGQAEHLPPSAAHPFHVATLYQRLAVADAADAADVAAFSINSTVSWGCEI